VQLPATEIIDTIEAVFRDPAFARASLLQRFGAWLLDLIASFLIRLDPRGMPPVVFWVLAAMLAVVLLALIVRGPRSVRAAAGRAASTHAAVGAGDAWSSARELATRGDFTAAAHALYAALLGFIAARGEIELHESKTIGDYVRELARRPSALLGRFRDFGRSYEWVIYGQGAVDRAGYDRLDKLAQQIVQHGG
jgi:hypothetical protein